MFKKIGTSIGQVAKDTIGQGVFDRTFGRLFNSGIFGKQQSQIKRATARWTDRDDTKDWRVKLTIPEQSPLRSYFFPGGNVSGSTNRLAPLAELGGIFWPLTPSMVIQHTASYDALAMAHSNYPFQAYQNSQVDQMNIIGEFPVQNQQDAVMWVATINFLRTITKMFFGQDEGQGFKGSPPPILHLSGYGDNMFNKVPVVVNSFNVELRSGIDYISTRQDFKGFGLGDRKNPNEMKNINFDANEFDQTWAPSLSNVSVLITPVYSRDTVKKFSLQKFAKGELNGNGGEGIGFI